MARVRVAAAPSDAGQPAPSQDPVDGADPPESRAGLVEVTEHTWVRRHAGWTYWLPALACVLGLTGLAATRSQPSVEATLTGQVRAALHRAELDEVSARVTGRSAIL